MPAPRIVFVLMLAAGVLQDLSSLQDPVDPALRSAVERFFAIQQAEDVEGYLALWSAKASRPRPEMLKYIFDGGDDRFSDIQVIRVMASGQRVRVRVSAVRDRTQPSRIEGRPPLTRSSKMDVSLTFVRENDEWKLLREGPASDDLAAALIEADDAEQRTRLLEAEPELLNERLLLALSRRAGEAAQMQDYAAARIGYERMLEAARHAGDRKYEGEALQNLGNAFYYQQQFAAALKAYEERLAIERERGDDEALAAAFGGIATIRYAFAEYGAALSAYREALAIHERLADAAAIAGALISTGNVLYLQGDFNGAIADYTRSRDLYRQATNPAGEARALEGLGRVLLARGDYARALEAFTGVLEEGRARGDHIVQGNATLNMGDAHLRLGNLEVARATFEESRGHFDAAKDAANAGRVWQAIALTDLMGGRFPLAEEEYKRSTASCTGVADQECVAGAAVGLGFAQSAQEKYADAIASYGTAIKIFTQLRRREQVARAQIGVSQALSGSGDYKAARQAAEDARQNGVVLDNDDVVWRALVAEARALRRLNDPAAALAAARAAAGALEQQVERALTRPASPVPRDSAAVFATLAVLQAETGDAQAAFETAERMRVHDLRISLAAIEREISRGMSDADREEERSIAVELVTLHAQLAREKDLPKPDPARRERLERSIADASARRRSQQHRLFERLPDLRTWRGLLVPATRSETAGVLDPGTILVQFVVDDDDLLILWARLGESGVEHSAHLRAMSRKSLAELVAELTPQDVLKDETAWRKAALALRDVLPESLRSSLAGSSDAIVVPHEVLWRVPFEAMPVDEGYLADKVRVRYAHSVSTLLSVLPRQLTSDEPSQSPALLIATAPVLHEIVRGRIERIAPGWTVRSPESGAAELEAVVGDTASERVITLTGADVTESALRDRLPQADLVHIGLPFRINGAGAPFSPILLTGDPGDDFEDGRADPRNNAALEAREVMNLQLRARLAVLSDGAAMSMRDAADDVALVWWAWRAAGVASLATARWADDTGASLDLLADLHARLRTGESAGAALRAAQRKIRQTKERAAPFYWAGWLLIGDVARLGGRR